jgi:DHA2 family methylenomycin A resistance protein-like MFS transporter
MRLAMCADRPANPSAARGLLALCAAYFAIILDAGILNLALPTIRRELHASVAEAEWVLSGYTLALASLLLLAGAAGDRFGHRRLLDWGIGTFGLASVLCAAAPNAAVLVAARLAQGVGAAGLLPATLALVPQLYPPGPARQRATLIWVGTGAVAMAAAPLVGGVLITVVGWRAVFAVNVPIAVVTLGLGRRNLPPPTRADVPLHLPQQALRTLALTGVAAAVIVAGGSGWTSALTLGCLGVAAACVMALFALRRTRPGSTAGWRVPRVIWAAVASAGIMGFTFYGSLLLLSLHLQEVRDWSPLRSGLALLPLTVASTAGPFLYGRLSRRLTPAALLAGGFLTVLAGTVVLVAAGVYSPYGYEVLAMLLIGGASTVVFSALTTIGIEGCPPERLGVLSGWQNTSRQAAAMLANTVVSSLLLGAPASREQPVAVLLTVAAALGVGIALTTVRRPQEAAA